MRYSKLVVAVFALFAAFTTAAAAAAKEKERRHYFVDAKIDARQFLDAKIDALLKKARKDGKSMNSCPKWYAVTIPGYGHHSGTLRTDKNCRRLSYFNPSTPRPKMLCRGGTVCSSMVGKSGWIRYPNSKVKKVVGPKDCTLTEWTYDATGCSFQYDQKHPRDSNHAWMRCSGIVPWLTFFEYSKCEIYTPAMEAAKKAAAEKKKKKETTQKETTQKERRKKKEKEHAAKKAAAAAEQAAKKEGAKKKETSGKKVATPKFKLRKKKAAAKRRLCGKENDSCACPSGSIMRYGHALLDWMKKKCDMGVKADYCGFKLWVDIPVPAGASSLHCGNLSGGGDPFPGMGKECYCVTP